MEPKDVAFTVVSYSLNSNLLETTLFLLYRFKLKLTEKMFKYHTILEITFHYFIEKKSMQREKVKQNKFRPKHSFKALFINRRRQTQQQ